MYLPCTVTVGCWELAHRDKSLKCTLTLWLNFRCTAGFSEYLLLFWMLKQENCWFSCNCRAQTFYQSTPPPRRELQLILTSCLPSTDRNREACGRQSIHILDMVFLSTLNVRLPLSPLQRVYRKPSDALPEQVWSFSLRASPQLCSAQLYRYFS